MNLLLRQRLALTQVPECRRRIFSREAAGRPPRRLLRRVGILGNLGFDRAHLCPQCRGHSVLGERRGLARVGHVSRRVRRVGRLSRQVELAGSRRCVDHVLDGRVDRGDRLVAEHDCDGGLGQHLAFDAHGHDVADDLNLAERSPSGPDVFGQNDVQAEVGLVAVAFGQIADGQEAHRAVCERVVRRSVPCDQVEVVDLGERHRGQPKLRVGDDGSGCLRRRVLEERVDIGRGGKRAEVGSRQLVEHLLALVVDAQAAGVESDAGFAHLGHDREGIPAAGVFAVGEEQDGALVTGIVQQLLGRQQSRSEAGGTAETKSVDGVDRLGLAAVVAVGERHHRGGLFIEGDDAHAVIRVESVDHVFACRLERIELAYLADDPAHGAGNVEEQHVVAGRADGLFELAKPHLDHEVELGTEPGLGQHGRDQGLHSD